MNKKVLPGKTYSREGVSTVDLLIKVDVFVKKVNNVFNVKMSWSKLVSTRRSTVRSHPPLVRVPWLKSHLMGTSQGTLTKGGWLSTVDHLVQTSLHHLIFI
jgi:hypothetical protein